MKINIATTLCAALLAVSGASSAYAEPDFSGIGRAISGTIAGWREHRKPEQPARRDAEGRVAWGQIGVPVQPIPPTSVVERIRALYASGALLRAPYADVTQAPGPEVSAGIHDGRGLAPAQMSPEARLIARMVPRIVLGKRVVPILGYSATIQDEAYPVYDNAGGWTVLVLERWVKPTPHIDAWRKLAL